MKTSTQAPIAQDVKVAIAAEAVKSPGVKTLALATQFNVSESTVRRAIKQYEAEAKALLESDAEKAKALLAKEAKKAKSLVTKEAVIAKQKVKRQRVESAAVAGPRGHKPRNGRWVILNKMFDELGLENPAVLYVEANKRSEAAGLAPLNKNSFYAMVGIARKLRKNDKAA